MYACIWGGGGLLFKVSFLEYPFNWACFFPLFLCCLVYCFSLLFTFIYLNLRIFKGEHLILLTYIYLYLNIEN